MFTFFTFHFQELNQSQSPDSRPCLSPAVAFPRPAADFRTSSASALCEWEGRTETRLQLGIGESVPSGVLEPGRSNEIPTTGTVILASVCPQHIQTLVSGDFLQNKA